MHDNIAWYKCPLEYINCVIFSQSLIATIREIHLNQYQCTTSTHHCAFAYLQIICSSIIQLFLFFLEEWLTRTKKLNTEFVQFPWCSEQNCGAVESLYLIDWMCARAKTNATEDIDNLLLLAHNFPQRYEDLFWPVDCNIWMYRIYSAKINSVFIETWRKVTYSLNTKRLTCSRLKAVTPTSARAEPGWTN